MFLERLMLTNFRCFGPTQTTIEFTPGVTSFVGGNGTGKTVVMQALQRLFGVTGDQRRIRRQDFHVPASEMTEPQQRAFVLEAILAFPELDAEDDGAASAVPEFFQQMAADESGQLKCRLRLEATWTDDGSLDGNVEMKYRAVRTFAAEVDDAACTELKAVDRSRIQLIYVPASRDGASQVTAFLRGRLWRAINWSEDVRSTYTSASDTLDKAFSAEPAISVVADAVQKRWQEVHTAGTDTNLQFRPLDLRFHEFIQKVEVAFHPDEAGRDRSIADLSDGQRSLFHIAMTAATLDIEQKVDADPVAAGFHGGNVSLPALTLIAVEEPENNLAPFYLSRIVRQLITLTEDARAQAVVSSHSASILSRIDPSEVRYFRLDAANRCASVREVSLPVSDEDASKFIREAVRAYPELYFARFVVLGEGASEEVVLPRLADALNFDIDRSFVAVVPLGGRHVNHLWKLLNDLEIPHATLLDLDWGRDGGGWGRIKTTYEQLLNNGVPRELLFEEPSPAGHESDLKDIDKRRADDYDGLMKVVGSLRQHRVYFCAPLDLDYSMLRAFPGAYQKLEPGRIGPSLNGDPRQAVLGEAGHGEFYGSDQEVPLRWYRYLFLGRGKPSTHVRALTDVEDKELGSNAPEELRALLGYIERELSPAEPPTR